MKKDALTKLADELMQIKYKEKTKIKRITITENLCDELWQIGTELLYNSKTATTNLTCKNILEKFNFIITPKENSWEIKREKYITEYIDKKLILRK